MQGKVRAEILFTKDMLEGVREGVQKREPC
jgi:hypothetical protein